MKQLHRYKHTLFLYYFVVFTLLTSGFIAFQYHREKQFKIDQLETTLRNITDVAHLFITQNEVLKNGNIHLLDSLNQILPQTDTRITVIDRNGQVLYDSFVTAFENMENHLMRPEIQKALYADYGSNIRHSATTNEDFYYYAHYYDPYFIRAAAVYNVKIQNLLKTGRLFFVFIAFGFIIAWIVLAYVTERMSMSITQLKDFVSRLNQGESLTSNITFPHNELGVIGERIVNIYNKLAHTKAELSQEREKLMQLLLVLKQGIGFFTAQKETILTNSHFIQYVNILAGSTSIDPHHFFSVEALKPLHEFLDQHLSQKDSVIHPGDLPLLEYNMERNARYFRVQCVIFQNRNFEIIIEDITKPEKRKILKQQLTSHVIHELKSPVESLQKNLEKLSVINELNADQLSWLRKATKQTNQLLSLVNDLSMLQKIEDAADYYTLEPVNVLDCLTDVLEEMQDALAAAEVNVSVKIINTVRVHGNARLLVSIFHNLLENTLNFTGEKTEVSIENYHHDDNYYYFSFTDNGPGLSSQHLSHIFDRFYKVNPSSARGSGLGLAIVKNAVQLQKGNISVKNRTQGGLEFLFYLPKAISEIQAT